MEEHLLLIFILAVAVTALVSVPIITRQVTSFVRIELFLFLTEYLDRKFANIDKFIVSHKKIEQDIVYNVVRRIGEAKDQSSRDEILSNLPVNYRQKVDIMFEQAGYNIEAFNEFVKIITMSSEKQIEYYESQTDEVKEKICKALKI